MFNMLVHDRAFGPTPKFPNIHNSYPVDCDKKSGTPIGHIWGWVAACSKKNGGINNLLIACHGAYVGGAAYEEEGGWGINLGTGIDLFNIASADVLKGQVNNIYFYVCGACQQPDPSLRSGEEIKLGYTIDRYNNRLMIQKMAEYTECNIYAARAEQRKIILSDRRGGFDFGPWEGKVELFKYVKNVGTIVKNVTDGMHDFGEED